MAISSETIQKVRERVDILDIISESVTIKKRGQNYIGLCPFHLEKTPSFNVHPAKNLYKCFGCGKTGDVINFIMDSKSMVFSEAITYLAQRYSIEIEANNSIEKQASKEPYYIALNFASKTYEANLHTNEGKDSLYYLHNRGYSLETIKRFEIGLAFNGYTKFKELAEKNQYKTEILEEAGLLKRGETSLYDTFRDRITCPIKDIQGRVIAFTARAKGSDMPKYINSPTTPVYSKSEALYGIFEAKEAIRDKDECFLVEGATDVIAVSNAGFENSVASLGTALTLLQCKLIKRFTSNLTIIFDGDKAGIKAAIKGIDIALEAGLNVKIVLMPDNLDPDEILKTKGSEYFKSLIEEKIDFIDFKIHFFDAELKDISTKATTINDITATIGKISDNIKRNLYIQKLSRLMDVPEREIKKSIVVKSDSDLPIIIEPVNKSVSKIERSFTFNNEFDIIRILVLFGSEKLVLSNDTNKLETDYLICEYIFENCELDLFDNSVLSRIYYLCQSEFEYGRKISINTLLSNPDNDIRLIAFEIQEKSQKSVIDWSMNGIIIDSDIQIACNSLFEIITRLKYRYVCIKERKAIAYLITSGDESVLPELDSLNRLKLELVRNIKQ